MNPFTEPTTTADRIIGVLSRVPADHHLQLRAWSLIRHYRKDALAAVAGVTDPAHAEAIVEDKRLVLLETLAAIVEPILGPHFAAAAVEGGAV